MSQRKELGRTRLAPTHIRHPPTGGELVPAFATGGTGVTPEGWRGGQAGDLRTCPCSKCSDGRRKLAQSLARGVYSVQGTPTARGTLANPHSCDCSTCQVFRKSLLTDGEAKQGLTEEVSAALPEGERTRHKARPAASTTMTPPPVGSDEDELLDMLETPPLTRHADKRRMAIKTRPEDRTTRQRALHKEREDELQGKRERRRLKGVLALLEPSSDDTAESGP